MTELKLGKPTVLVYVINVDWYFDLHWLQRALAARESGATVHIIMGMTDPAINGRLSEQGFTCHPWNIDRKSINPLLNLKRLFDLYALLKGIAPDIIHAITIKPNINVGLLARFINTPYILSVTGTGIIFSGKSLRVRLIRPIVRFLYKLAGNKAGRKLSFENREDRDYFVNTGLCSCEEAVTILGAGVNPEQFNVVQENLNHQPVILFAARLLWDKGLGDLVEAGRLLQQRGLDFSIDVAGIIDEATINAIDQATLDAWVQEGLIRWLGTVKNMPALIAGANIVVLPTFYGEGVPRILIEAASCARAIITTDIAGCREIVKPGVNGLLVPPRDVQALADALVALIEDPQRRETMGQHGRELVESEFTEQQVIAETLSLYRELLS